MATVGHGDTGKRRDVGKGVVGARGEGDTSTTTASSTTSSASTSTASSSTTTRASSRAASSSSCRAASLWAACALGAALLAAAVKLYADRGVMERQEMALRTLGNDGLFLFTSLDTNMDMQISPEEFRPIVDKIIGPPPSEYEGTQEADPQGEGLTVLARFEPLLMETMSKSRDGFLGVGQSCLAGLRSWKKAETPSQHFGANQFKVFLPPKSDLELGEAWWIVPNDLNLFTGYLPNSRYYPPPPVAKEIIIFKLLSMLHPRPFVKSRFAPQGSVACIRAQSDMYYDIVFRVHAEFQLNEPPAFPFWFTPAQFTGHVTIARDSSHVRAFHMFVPNNRSLNVDMEWLFGSMDQGNMEVDIGFMPKMELVAEGPSVPALIYDENGNAINTSDPDVEPIQFVFENIEWRSEISFQEAYRQMEVAMYPFKKIQYHPFTEAFEKAKAEDKLVHSILLWGALDDQSC